MPLFTERDGLSILDSATDPEGDSLSVTEVNGSSALIGAAIPLSVGGSITVAGNGSVVFNDTGFTWPALGNSLFDSVIATVSDGVNNVSVTVDIRLNNV